MITVRFFSLARDAVGAESIAVDINVAKNAGELLDHLSAAHPKLAAMRKTLLLAVNMEMCSLSHPLRDDDEVAVMPPMQGG